MNSQLFFKIKAKTNLGLLLVFTMVFLYGNFNVYAQKKDFVVVLDAGHGGKDPGKVGYNKVKEKDIALDIVLRVGKILQKEKNIEVIYTRKTDVFIGLMERGKIANKADADLFVSIHCNAHSSQAYGSETWVLGTHANHKNFEVAKAENAVISLEEDFETKYKGFDPNSPESIIGLTLMQEEYLDQSIQLANIIQDDFTYGLKRKNRGVKQAGFVVLHQTYMPSVLIETGFISNKNEATYLNSSAGKQKFAQSIAKGIKKYIQQVKLNTVEDTGISIVQNATTKNSVSNDEEFYKNVTFKVQVAAGKKLETKSYNFNGLRNIERVRVGKIYRYYLGNTSSFNEIKEVQKKAKAKGYKSAFVVAFKNGKRVPLEDVLKKS
jgi:N-acetylmuramoyl-L-alanine amidase